MFIEIKFHCIDKKATKYIIKIISLYISLYYGSLNSYMFHDVYIIGLHIPEIHKEEIFIDIFVLTQGG